MWWKEKCGLRDDSFHVLVSPARLQLNRQRLNGICWLPKINCVGGKDIWNGPLKALGVFRNQNIHLKSIRDVQETE